MKRISYADLRAEYTECQIEINLAITRCIDNSSFIQGPEVTEFEKSWANYTDSPACAGVSSGTSALMLALSALGVKRGCEVIVPAMSFISTAEVVDQLGAIPIFVDIDQYHTMDISQVAQRINPCTRAIIFVDLYGQTIDIDHLKSVAGEIPLVQDAAQAAGCRYLGQPNGNLVDATCWSFYPGKNLSAMGDAGAVTGRPEVIDQVKLLRDHGRKEKYVHNVMGWNERLDGIQAAILRAKMPKLDIWNARRAENAEIYKTRLHGLVTLPLNNPCSNHVYNQFVIETDHRDQLKSYLAEQDIETGIQFPLPMHQQPVYNRDISLPRSENLARHCLSLPIHAHCTHQDIETVCDQIQNFFSQFHHSG